MTNPPGNRRPVWWVNRGLRVWPAGGKVGE
jgi:hypothetical protein